MFRFRAINRAVSPGRFHLTSWIVTFVVFEILRVRVYVVVCECVCVSMCVDVRVYVCICLCVRAFGCMCSHLTCALYFIFSVKNIQEKCKKTMKQVFRFDQSIAHVANCLVGMLRGETRPLLGNASKHGQV